MSDIIRQPEVLALEGILLLIVLIAVIFYIKYDWIRLRGLENSLRILSGKGGELPGEQQDRMDALLTQVHNLGNPILQTVWGDFYREYAEVLKGELVPDPAYYFSEQRLIQIPCGRRLMDRVWQALLFLGIGGAFLYPALTLLGLKGAVTGQEIFLSGGISLLLLAAVSFILFLFRMADAAQVEKTRQSLWEFRYRLGAWLNPVSEPTMVRVLIDSMDQNARLFGEAVDRLESRLDSFETDSLAPMLGNRFQEAIERNITPVLEEASGVLVSLSASLTEKQENGMRELAQTFAEKLSAVAGDKLARFGEEIGAVSGVLAQVVLRLEQVRQEMEEHLKSQELVHVQSREALREAGRRQGEVAEALKTSLESVRTAEGIALEMREYAVSGLGKADEMVQHSLQLLNGNLEQVQSMQREIGEMSSGLKDYMENSVVQISKALTGAVTNYALIFEGIEASRKEHGEKLDTRIQLLVDSLDERLEEHNSRTLLNSQEMTEKFQGILQEVLASNGRTAEQLDEAVSRVSLEGGRILEKTSRQATELYSELSGRMDRSIDALGENLSAVMKAAMGDSVEIVEKLAVRTSEMKEFYDSYFTRVGEQTSQTLDELDFNVQKIMASFSTETTQIISRITDHSSGALEFFDKGIKDLMENMDEHSRSIGLYAKEINMDIADLSKNLRNSVQVFSGEMEAGVNRTFEDFDRGLGEVTLRLATLMESIRESAEALQKALNQ